MRRTDRFRPGTFWEYTNPRDGRVHRFTVDRAGRARKENGRLYAIAPWSPGWWYDVPKPEFRQLLQGFPP